MYTMLIIIIYFKILLKSAYNFLFFILKNIESFITYIKNIVIIKLI